MLQRLFTHKERIVHLFAESVGWQEVGHIDVGGVGVCTQFADIVGDAHRREIKRLERGEFIAQVAEVDGVDASLQREVGDAVGLLLGE